MYNSYRKAISNLDELRKQRLRIWFATVDNNGTMSKDFDTLVKLIARLAYPGSGPDRKWDVDGLRSRCVSRLRVAVGVGVWRANHKTLAAWAERSYPSDCNNN